MVRANLDKVMETNGGSNNAYTTHDVTVYQDWFPHSALPLIFDIEADRIRDLSFDPKKIKSEREVVASERRLSVENENRRNAGRADCGRLRFIAHPIPVAGGWMDERHRTLDDGGPETSLRNGIFAEQRDDGGGRRRVAEEIFKLCETEHRADSNASATAAGDNRRAAADWARRRLVVHKQAELPLLMLGITCRRRTIRTFTR